METHKSFDVKRRELAPYGLTCEKWNPIPTPRLDRHNEIEINYFPHGGATYLANSRMVEFPAQRLIVFWALLPHKTMSFASSDFYYTCTIPLNVFLSWKISQKMCDDLFSGRQLVAPDATTHSLDEQLLSRWYQDLEGNPTAELQEVVTGEMCSRLKRFSLDYLPLNTVSPTMQKERKSRGIYSEESDKITKLVTFIASNFNKPLRLEDIGEAVGLHPDYANKLCRKAFGYTLHECLLQERVNHVERMLITTDTPITQIALQCGFTTIARFNATFLRQKGCTPSEYRRNFSLSLQSPDKK